MSEVAQGIPASPGIVIGPACVVPVPGFHVPHTTVAASEVENEVRRFHAARQDAIRITQQLRQRVEERVGSVQAKIFDPQLLMLEDPELIDGAVHYISESCLTAERAFSLRVLEFLAQWLYATHARVMDRVADLNDVQARVLSSLSGNPLPSAFQSDEGDRVILVARELTPSHIVELDPERVLGLAMDAGTRTAHASILARSLSIPAVVGLVDLSRRIESGVDLILDGDSGKVVVGPTAAEKSQYHDRDLRARAAARELEHLVGEESATRDGVRIKLFANLELPVDAELAANLNADGVGLFRTEFLVVGRAAAPEEQEQYESFRGVVERIAPRPVTIRTFDLGGDKFPLFLPPLAEENPFLGWRGLRIYQRIPQLFRAQLRAILRVAALGPVRLMVPMVNTVEEVTTIRSVLNAAREELRSEAVEHGDVKFGVMLETPAAVGIAEVLARHVDFFSLGTNDLIQYLLAVDRGNAQLASYFDLYHPAVLRFIRSAVLAAEATGRPLCACGEAASDPVGAALLIGLGIRGLSCSPTALLGQKQLIRSIRLDEIERLALELLEEETGTGIRVRLTEAVGSLADFPSLNDSASLSRRP